MAAEKVLPSQPVSEPRNKLTELIKLRKRGIAMEKTVPSFELLEEALKLEADLKIALAWGLTEVQAQTLRNFAHLAELFREQCDQAEAEKRKGGERRL